MFKNFRNEARIFFWLHTAGPLLIKGPDQPGLDPLQPDMSFVRAWRNGREVPYIPGSSLKGVLRSRAEQIIRALAPDRMAIPDPFQRGRDDEMKDKPGDYRYYASDPVTQLFGQTYLAGRLRCADAFPVEDRPLVLNERNHVAINRITGATQGKALFNPEVVEEGTFAAEISLTNFAVWQLKLLGVLLQDLDDGFLLLGGSTTRGYGRVRVENAQVLVRDYRRDPPAEVLRGYEHDDTVPVAGCRYTNKGYCWEAAREGFEWLLTLKVDLAETLERLHRKQMEVQQKWVNHGG
ncbi:RAMP superfamily CRISPR-associated protein [Desulfofundulus thermosubterraneus]|uniref:CRISPR-associated RAMP protein, SSO1426 family n=1 Tax=Desulfofundulus thermosubterraneus DSM 16057 TaxID=1121432 RepID=A0A1M6FFH1_9FIRM|nr:RAMP superfamily CRISPR-associated protein [Desulfofundulus thermosubterraneus]SHI96366.1 CRISPR-associated RAMP protein, SSO1426 family [Desulfofundulus thermosubterraneus DSM 16057]